MTYLSAINSLPQSTGHSFICPGPIAHDGLQLQDMDFADSKNYDVVKSND